VSEDLTGRRLGHYRIDGVLGRGGMSVMYKATDVRLGRKVALKVIGEHLGEDAEFRERFVDEARNVSAIDHANVVPLYDFGEVDGLLYIAMRLVDGADLASLVKDGPISVERTLALLGQVAEALDTLHDRGLVHPDAYSLACVLFACLTGRPPFQGKVPEVIQGHLNQEPPAVTGLVALPGGIDEVIRRGMAKDPKVRYATCKELVAAARQALSQAPRREPPRPAPTYQQPPRQPQPLTPPVPQPAQHQGPGEFVRLRPPVPVGSSAFTAEKTGTGGRKWVLPVVVGVIAIAAIVLAIVFLTKPDDSGPTTPDTNSPPISINPRDSGGSKAPTSGSHSSGTSSTSRRTVPTLTGIPTS
jgi:serine/threonine protein kinase